MACYSKINTRTNTFSVKALVRNEGIKTLFKWLQHFVVYVLPLQLKRSCRTTELRADSIVYSTSVQYDFWRQNH